MAVMTTHHDILTSLRSEWRAISRGPQSRTALDTLRQSHPEVALGDLRDLGDLVLALELRGGRTVLERAAIVQAMLEHAGDRMLHRALLQTLIPGIVSVCRQLRFGEGIVRDPSETVAMALGLASELLVDWAGQSRQYAAPDILSALRGRLRRWLLKEKAACRSISAYENDDIASSSNTSLETRLAGYRGSTHDRLARLTYARVYEGRSLHDLAREDRCAPGTLQAELQRFAIRFLL